MKYRREIDGLRAIAVLPVILFHAGFKTFSGGFVGVDVFFVISGYLITTIILSDMNENRFSIVEFYERRARRILPALFFLMLCCLLPAWLWLSPKHMKEFCHSLTAISIFSSNILFWLESGYFETASELKPLLHTWSLAVEEQYYVLFPLFLMLLWRLRKRSIFTYLTSIAFLSLAAAQWGAYNKPAATFFLLPTRGWELAIGALIAFYFLYRKNHLDLINSHKKTSELLGALGLLLIGYSIFSFSKATPFPSLYALIPTIGTGLIILFSSQKTMVGRFLGLKPMVGIGLISYSVYLWHQPIFVFARHRSIDEPNELRLITFSLLSIFLGFLSWRFIEIPFRNKKRFSRKNIFSLTVVFSVFFISIGLYGHLSSGLPQRFKVNSFAINDDFDMPKISNGWCFYSVDTLPGLEIGNKGLTCCIGDNNPGKKAILFGDSFAGQYEPFWDIIGKEINIQVNAVTTNWCYPSLTQGFTGPTTSRAFDQCIFNRNYLINNLSHYDIIILSADWGGILAQNKIVEVFDLITHIGKQENIPIVIMASPTKISGRSLDRIILKGYGNPVISHRDDDAARANNLFEKLADQNEQILFINRTELFGNFDNKDAVLTDEGVPFSFDGSHLSIYGSKKAAHIFLKSRKFSRVKQLINNK